MTSPAPKRTAFTWFPGRLVPSDYGYTDTDGNFVAVMLMERLLDGEWVPDPIIEKRRFSNAELAAIFWAPNWITNPDLDFDGAEKIMRERSAVLLRFATLPDYDTQDDWDIE